MSTQIFSPSRRDAARREFATAQKRVETAHKEMQTYMTTQTRDEVKALERAQNALHKKIESVTAPGSRGRTLARAFETEIEAQGDLRLRMQRAVHDASRAIEDDATLSSKEKRTRVREMRREALLVQLSDEQQRQVNEMNASVRRLKASSARPLALSGGGERYEGDDDDGDFVDMLGDAFASYGGGGSTRIMWA